MTRARASTRTRRRATIYIFMLAMATLVVTAGIAGSMTAQERSLRRSREAHTDQADRAARSGLEVALRLLDQDPNGVLWRTAASTATIDLPVQADGVEQTRIVIAPMTVRSDGTLALGNRLIDSVDPLHSRLRLRVRSTVGVGSSAVSSEWEAVVRPRWRTLSFLPSTGGTAPDNPGAPLAVRTLSNKGMITLSRVPASISDQPTRTFGAGEIDEGTDPQWVTPIDGDLAFPLPFFSASVPASLLTLPHAEDDASDEPMPIDALRAFLRSGRATRLNPLGSLITGNLALSPAATTIRSYPIVVVDGGGAGLTVRDMRLDACLVIMNASSVQFADRISLRPPPASATSPHLPALVLLDVPLVRFDLNPIDFVDGTPSMIRGAVIVAGAFESMVEVQRQLHIEGGLMINGSLDVAGAAELTVRATRADEPLLGFSTTTHFELVPASVRPVKP